jgi:chaperonin cofactor prefoldin
MGKKDAPLHERFQKIVISKQQKIQKISDNVKHSQELKEIDHSFHPKINDNSARIA